MLIHLKRNGKFVLVINSLFFILLNWEIDTTNGNIYIDLLRAVDIKPIKIRWKFPRVMWLSFIPLIDIS